MEIINVVVIGGLHHNTLGVIRSLGECKDAVINMKAIIITEDSGRTNIISSSRYIKTKDIIYVTVGDDIVSYLKKIAEDDIFRVIICCSDEAAEVVISHRDDLKKHYATPSSKIQISSLMNKEVQTSIARRCGMHIPFGSIFQKSDVSEWNTFPCIIKPVSSIKGGGKKDIRVCHNREDFDQSLQTVESDTVQIQLLIDKDMEYQLIGCSLDAGAEILIPGYTRIIRQPPNTNTGYLVYSPISHLQYDYDAVTKFVREIGYSGLFSIEFIRGEDNVDYFLEINMRNDGNAYCVKTAGINLPYIWCYYQMHHRIPNVPIEFHDPIWFIPDFADMRLGIHEKGLIKWIYQFIKADSHAIYNKRDLKPFVVKTFQLIRKII